MIKHHLLGETWLQLLVEWYSIGNILNSETSFKKISISSNACVHANIRLMTLKIELVITISSIFFNGTDRSVWLVCFQGYSHCKVRWLERIQEVAGAS